jgi:DNA helicase-2/ATP-dependent DNA helicase PcrA
MPILESPLDNFLRDLTPAQREAVVHREGPLLILAGPGSGKTRVITHRIAYLLTQDVAAREILALTFTNKAADEMRTRVEQLAPGESVWVGTFHRFCARLLRKYAPLVGIQENYTIYDVADSRRALTQVIRDLPIDMSGFTTEAIGSAISWAKNNLISPEDYQPRPGHALGSIVARVYPAYQKRLAKCNAADFDDLLLHVAVLLRENAEVRRRLDERFRFVLIDEYQDTNLAQYTIARALSIDYPNLAVTGDPDQSIYGWRGANLTNILDFEHDFPNVRVVRLERNYRSTPKTARANRCGWSDTPTKRRKPGRSPHTWPTRSVPAAVGRGISPSSIESTPCRSISSGRCANRACRTRWSAAWSFFSGRKSRTFCPICSCWPIRTTTWRCCV